MVDTQPWVQPQIPNQTSLKEKKWRISNLNPGKYSPKSKGDSDRQKDEVPSQCGSPQPRFFVGTLGLAQHVAELIMLLLTALRQDPGRPCQ